MSKLGDTKAKKAAPPDELSALADPRNVDLRIVDDEPDAPASEQPAPAMTPEQIQAILAKKR